MTDHATITLHLPLDMPMRALGQFARAIGCRLDALPDGSYIARRQPIAGNGNRQRRPLYKRQLHGINARAIDR